MKNIIKALRTSQLHTLSDDELKKTDQNNKGLLHYAASYNSLINLDYLLEKRLNVNQLDSNGESAIFLAVRFGNLEITKKLINQYSQLNLKNIYGENLLHLAVSNGNTTIVQLLIESKVSLTEKTLDELSIIQLAILHGHLELTKYLIIITKSSWYQVDQVGNTLLHYAARTSNLRLIRYFLKELELNPNLINTLRETPIFQAAKYGNHETIKLLLDYYSYYSLKNIDGLDILTIIKNRDFEEYLLVNEYLINPKYTFNESENGFIIGILNEDVSLIGKNIAFKNKVDRFNKNGIDYMKLFKLNKLVYLTKQ